MGKFTITERELLQAARAGDLKNIKKAQKAQINLNVCGENGYSLLTLTIIHKQHESALCLAEDIKVNQNLQDKYKDYPLIWAMRANMPKIAETLAGRNDVKPKLKGRHGTTALSLAKTLEEGDLIRLLEKAA